MQQQHVLAVAETKVPDWYRQILRVVVLVTDKKGREIGMHVIFCHRTFITKTVRLKRDVSMTWAKIAASTVTFIQILCISS